jgi:hypothetical protein
MADAEAQNSEAQIPQGGTWQTPTIVHNDASLRDHSHNGFDVSRINFADVYQKKIWIEHTIFGGNAGANGPFQKTDVAAATTTALPANTYNNGSAGVGATLTATSNGVLTVDGVTIGAYNRVLVQNEAVPAYNGIYYCSTVGTVSTKYVLTRDTDSDTSAELQAAFVNTSAGTANGGIGFANTNWASITIGSTPIRYTPFPIPALALNNYATILIVPTSATLTGFKEVHKVAASDSSAVTLMLEKLIGTTNPGYGVDMLTSAISLKGANNTIVTGTLTPTLANRSVAVGDRMGLRLSGATTSLVDVTVQIELTLT